MAFEDELCRRGNICPEYLRFNKRVVRVLRTLAETGTADFSSAAIRKKYAVSDEAHRMTQEILDHHGLEGEARIEMDRVIRHLFHYAETRGCRCSDITDETLMDFFVNELPKTNKGSMGRALRAIKYVSEYMKTCGFSQLVLDFSQLNARGSHVRVIQPYSSEEVGCMLESVDTSTGAGMRDYAIMLLAFETGLRGVDIRKIKLSDIDWRHGRIRICQNKTSEPLILPLTGRAMNAIADYVLKCRPDCGLDEVFLTVRGPIRPMNIRYHSFSSMMAKYESLAGIEKVEGRAFHSLRRSFATELSAGGVPLETISQLLGHKSIEEDKPYLSYNREQIAFCALGFDGITVKTGMYKTVKPTAAPEGGDAE